MRRTHLPKAETIRVKTENHRIRRRFSDSLEPVFLRVQCFVSFANTERDGPYYNIESVPSFAARILVTC